MRMKMNTLTRLILAFFLLSLGFSEKANAQSFSEGFDDITTLPAAGWGTRNNSSPIGSTNWFQGNNTVFAANSGAATSYIGANFNNTTGNNTISNWLITPNRTISNGDVISFFTRTVSIPQFADRLEVRLSTNGVSSDVGTTNVSVGDFTTLLLSVNPTLTTSGYPNAWTKYTITVSGLAGPTSSRFAFRYFVTSGGPSGANSDYIGIDDFVYTAAIVCAKPTITCANDTTIYTDAGLCTASGVVLNNPTTITDCGFGSLLNNAPTTYTLGATNVLWKVKDVNGDSATCTQIVTVVDTAKPAIVCKPASSALLYDNGPFVSGTGDGFGGANTSQLQGNLGMGTFGFTVNPTIARLEDDFTISNLSGWKIDSASFFAYQTGSTTTSTLNKVTLQIWNGKPNAGGVVVWGNTTTNLLASTAFTGAYRVTNTTLTNSQRPIMKVTAALGGVTLAPGTYWLDWTISGTLASGPFAPPLVKLGQTTTGDALQFTTGFVNALDGGTSTQQGLPFTLFGSDFSANDKFDTIQNNTGVCAGTITLPVPSTSDNCAGISSLTNSFNGTGNASGSYPVGTTTVTWTVIDNNSNTNTCLQVVTVLDTTKPTAVCQNVTVQLDGSNNASITAALVDNGSFDNCAIKSITVSPSTFTCANLGANSVTLIVTDSVGHVDSCTATVTVQDTTKPSITCPADLTLYTNEFNCGIFEYHFFDTATAADNCGGVSVITPQQDQDFAVGVHTITWIATDASGNVDSCHQTLTVLDTVRPVITCPADISVSNDAGICGAVVTFADPTATDNCGGGASVADSSVFNFTGAQQTFTVPAGVTSVTIQTWGAQGGAVVAPGTNLGGYSKGDFAVTPGQVLNVYVGEQPTSTTGGFNGGGNGFSDFGGGGAGGGGASDVRLVGNTLNDRIIVAGGGGGGSSSFSGDLVFGGVGGGLNGGNGYRNPDFVSNPGGEGGSQSASGTGTCITFNNPATAGGFGFGGTASGCGCAGFGGGGGWWGGAGSGNCRGGGGGSGYVLPASTNTNIQAGLQAGNGRVVISYTSGGSSTTVTQIAGLTSGSTFPKGTSVVTFVATDTSGNTDTCSFNVTVSDTSKPTAVCQNVTVQLDGSNNASITASQVDNGSTDNCAIKSISVSPSTFTCANLGANTVTLTVTDSSNNVSTCQATVTVQDTTLPTITCPSNITVNKDADACGAVVTFLVTGTDNCGTPTITSSPASGSLFPVGTTTVNDTARDAAGNIAVCSFTVTVNPPFDSVQNVTICRGDTIAPSSGLVAFGSCGGTTTITATTQVFPGTTVGASTYNRSVSGSSYSASGVGTDVNWDTVRFTVPITGVYVVNADAIGYDGFLTLHQSSFNPASPATDFVFASDDSIGTDGAMRRTLTAGVTYYAVVSAFDNGDAGPYSLSVVPQFTGSITVSGKPIWYNTPTGGTVLASDSVFNPIGVPGSGLANSDTFGVFNYYVACPSDSGCRRLVTLTINNAPTVNQVSNQRLCLGGSTVAANFTGAVANTTYNWTNSNPAIGLPASGSGDIASFVPTAAGVAVITVTPSNATTACPTGKAIIFTIRVDSVSVGGTVGPDSSFCSTTNTGDLFLKGYTGTIVRWEISTNGGATWTNVAITGNAITYTDLDSTTLVRALLKSGVCDSAYSTPATITIFNGPTSATLSTNPGSQFLISEDFTGSNPPAGWLTRNNSSPLGSTGWFRGNPTVFVANSSPDSSYIAANYNSTGTFGDISNWLILPNITLKNGDNFSFFTRTSDFPQFADNLQVRMSTNGASSNVGTTSASVGDFTNLLLDINPGLIATTYPNNWKQYTLTISGLSGPTSGRLAFRYVVPDGGLFGDNSDYIGIDDVQYSTPAAPICSGDTVSIKVTVTSGAGPFEVVYTDGLNNYTESNYVSGTAINVVPTQNVSYSLISVTDTNGCSATALLGLSDIIVNPKPDVDQPTSIVVCQNSTVPTVLFTGTVPNTVYDWTGTSSSIGLATSGTDSIGSFVAVNNTSSPIVDTITVTPSYSNLGTTCLGTPKTFTITVNPGPVAVCKNTTVSLDSAGNASIIAADVDGGSTASCGIQSITVSKSSFTCANVGLDSVVLTVTDSSGNTASCTAYVTVQDTIKPVITCPADIAVYSDSGVCGAKVSFVVSGTDNCGAPTIVSSYASGSIFPVGVTTVNDTAFDASGNKSVCSFTVTVTDTTKPIITCPADFTLYTNQFNCGVYELFLDSATATDACGVSVTSPQQNGDFPVGVNVITWIATDANGNVDSCHQILTVVDTIKPEIVCPANIAVSNDSGVCGAIVNFSSNVSDNCEVDTTIASPASGSFFPVGTTTVNYTATDIHGNTSTCSFTVTVTDTTKPVIVCPSNITVSNDSGICGAKVSFSVTATDNCSLATVVSSPSSGSTFPVGTTIVSDTATDIYGNVSVCTFTVTVSDTTKPSITCAADTVLNPDGGSCFATATLNVPLVSDNCGIDDLFSDVSAPFAQGNTVVTWTVIDNNGNQNTCLQNVYVNNTDTLKGDKLDSICPYTQYDLTAQTFNGVSGSDLDWSLSTATPSSVDTGTFLGVYTLANGGCKDTVAVTVIYRFKPDIGPDQADSICLFTTYDLNSLDYNGFSPLVWNTPNPGAVSSGVYTGVYTSPISGCTDTVVVTITYKVKPDVGVDRALILCDNTTLDLNSLIYNNLSPLVWDTPNPSAVSAGVFTGVYTAPNGCTDSVVVTTTLRTSPNLGADVVDSICTNSTVDLGSYGFNGYTPLAWSTKLLGTIVGPGNYTGVYIDPVSNCRDSVLVSILPKFTPDLGRDFGDSVCGGTTFDLTALAPNGFTPLVWNTSTPAAVTSGTFTGIYTASNSCADTIDVTINIRVKPNLGPDKTDSICADLKYNLNTLSFNGLSPLNWQGVQDPTSVSPGASYTAIYVAPNSCADTAVATIVAKALPLQPAAFTASSAVICQGTGKVTYTVPNDPAVTYEWSYSGFGVNIIGSGNSVQLDFAPFATAGTLSVVAVAKNGCGKSIARTIDIVVNHEPVVTIISSEADNSICFGQTVVFTAHGAGTYEFFLNGRSQGIAKDSTFTFTGSVEGTNSVYVIGTNVCGSDTSGTLLLDVHENPVVDAGLDTLVTKGNSVQLQGTATGVAPFYFNWTPSLTLNLATVPNPIATPLDDTEYYLTVANQYGCSATDSVRVRVVLDEVYEFPTLITPNGDGSNDVWVIDLDRFPGADLIIFNRWGQIVYENAGYDNTWNGTYKGTGKDCDDGTYYFIMKVPSLDNKVYKGPINIVRSKK